MLPTKFWADVTWPESRRVAMSTVIEATIARAETRIGDGVGRFVALLRDTRAFDLSRPVPGPAR